MIYMNQNEAKSGRDARTFMPHEIAERYGDTFKTYDGGLHGGAVDFPSGRVASDRHDYSGNPDSMLAKQFEANKEKERSIPLPPLSWDAVREAKNAPIREGYEQAIRKTGLIGGKQEGQETEKEEEDFERE